MQGYVLRLLRWRGAKAYIESLVVLATAYLTFYVAQASGGMGGWTCPCRCSSSSLRLPACWLSSQGRRSLHTTPSLQGLSTPHTHSLFPQRPAKGSGMIALHTPTAFQSLLTTL